MSTSVRDTTTYHVGKKSQIPVGIAMHPKKAGDAQQGVCVCILHAAWLLLTKVGPNLQSSAVPGKGLHWMASGHQARLALQFECRLMFIHVNRIANACVK